MKRWIHVLSATLLSFSASAQQLGHYNQYVQNPYIINPAVAGCNNWTDITLGFRKQWTGLATAPKTYYISGHAPIKPRVRPPGNPSIRSSYMEELIAKQNSLPSARNKFAVGGNAISDNAGMFRRNSAALGGAYHIGLGSNKSTFISVGLQVGIANYSFDQSLAVLSDPNDDTYTKFIGQGSSFNFLDGTAGLWFYSKDLFIGYSANQLAKNYIPIGQILTNNELNIHHFAMMGYSFHVSEDVTIKPAIIGKYMNPAPLAMDFTVILDYKGRFWTGFTYRQGDAAVAMLGLTISDLVRFGYSFEYTISELQNYNSGGHEIVLGLMLSK